MDASVTRTIIGLAIPLAGTTAGAAMVFLMRGRLNHAVGRALTGFAAGVMVAASVWSLIVPAIEESSAMGRLAWVPAFVGFWLGILFLLLLDSLLPHLHLGYWIENSPKMHYKSRFRPCEVLDHGGWHSLKQEGGA